ncbi:MAG: DUF4760 domain-containing protein [Nitrospirota bacterium]|nr:DUF4760 domain-containing protein [Nitrospirota bacterium]
MKTPELVSFLYFFCLDTSVITATAITIGVIPAILSLFLSTRFEWNKHRGLETIKYLGKDNPLANKAFLALQKYISKTNQYTAPSLPTCYSIKDLRHIINFSNQYEDLFVSIRSGLIDEKQIRNAEESTICDFFMKFHGVLNNYRKEKNRPTFFENYEIGYLRWKILKVGPLQKLIEIIINKPLWRWTKFRTFTMMPGFSWKATDCERFHEKVREGKSWWVIVGLVYWFEWVIFGGLLFAIYNMMDWLYIHLPWCLEKLA